MNNLVELLRTVVGPGGSEKLGSVLDVRPQQAQQAIDGAIPAILGGLIQQVAQPHGPEMLERRLEGYDEGLLDQLDQLWGESGSAQRQAIVTRGPEVLQDLFAGNLSSVLEAISKRSQIDLEKVRALLAMLVPIVMGFLKRQRREQGWDVADLARVLISQQGALEDWLPAGVADALGAAQTVRDSAAATLRETTHVVKDVPAPTAEPTENKSLFGKSAPILIVIAVLLAVAKYFQIQNAEKPQPRPMVEEVLPGDPSMASPAGDLGEPGDDGTEDEPQ